MIKNNQKDFAKKLKKFYQIRKSYAHKKTKTTANVINKSKQICFGDLSDIKCVKIVKREFKICKSICRI